MALIIACMFSSSESWELQQHPRLRHSCAGGGAVHSINTGHVASVRYCLVLFGGGSGGSQAESSGPEASASIRAAITKSDSCNPPIFRVVNDTSQKPHPNASSG